MPIKSLELSNVGPFRPRLTIRGLGEPALALGMPDMKMDFDKDVNLFIGPNSSGKSTVLHALYVLTRQVVDAHFGGDVSSNARLAGPSWVTDEAAWFTIESYGVDRPMSGPFSAFGSFSLSQYIELIPWNQIVNDYGFVGYRFSESDIDAGIQLGDIDALIEHQENLSSLTSAHNIARLHDSEDEFDRQILDAIFEVLSHIGPEFPVVINGETFDASTSSLRGKSLEQIWIDSKNLEDPTQMMDLGGYTVETIGGAHRFMDLSHGTLSTIAWVSRLVLGMGRRYNGDPKWKERPGIFIIDEIDAHLHPSWQRRIIPTLQRHFPNVQIFASTHSPMMVTGLKKGQVHLLKRNETTGAMEWSRNPQGIIGWTADEIYRTFMGIDDPTDEQTARHAEELRELRNKDSLTPHEETRMQELRRLVNEDLLAGGWLKAQDERFDEMMRRFMANRMSDLSQDGA